MAIAEKGLALVQRWCDARVPEHLWRDRNQAFHEYDRAEPSPRLQRLLDVVDLDETCIFWG